MRDLGTFALQVQPATTVSPTRVAVVVTGVPLDEQGQVHLSPECLTLDELEGQLNGLQDELDVLWAEARRVSPEELVTLEQREG